MQQISTDQQASTDHSIVGNRRRKKTEASRPAPPTISSQPDLGAIGLPPKHNIHFTEHAIARYCERMLNGATREVAVKNLHALVAEGRLCTYCPEWVVAHRVTKHYLIVNNRVAMPLIIENGHWVALSLLHRPSLPKRTNPTMFDIKGDSIFA